MNRQEYTRSHRLAIWLFVTLIGGLPLANADEPVLMPYPKSLTHTEGYFSLDEQLVIITEGAAQTAEFQRTIDDFHRRLQLQTGLTLADEADDGESPTLVIRVAQQLEPYLNLEQMTLESEAYQLTIAPTRITLTATTQLGGQHGLETLLQLIGSDLSGSVQLPAMVIDDIPRFRWRGLMLDSVRRFISVDTIKRQLDGMAAAKLNVFHWHLTDDQGWRLESRAYPKLHELASQGLYYTWEEVRDVIDYAAQRGIQVLPEIDMPGHTSAIGVAYPELMSAPGPYPEEDRWGVHRPLLNPANEAVYTFAEKIMAEVAELFPFDYVHIGGDEVDPRDWLENPDILAFMAARELPDAEALHAYFNQRLAKILAGLDRKMIGWDEVLHPDLPRDAAVQSWRGPDALGLAAKQGHYAILSMGFYLDLPQPASYHYRQQFFRAPLVGDQPGEREHWASWAFEFPRLRGAPISGTFTLIESLEGKARGFINFTGQSRQVAEQLCLSANGIHFTLDTWMGPVRARFTRQGKQLDGDLVVGNAAYPVTFTLIGQGDHRSAPPAADLSRPTLDDDSRARVLGGEITLWSELIDEYSIDRRLWPRAFAAAERFWSPRERRDQNSMYRRLEVIDRWAEQSLGLMHRQQTQARLERLLPASQVPLAYKLSHALEPAQYYHRHHEKSVRETYSRRDPLDRYVDGLPSQSHAVRRWRQQLADWLANPEDQASFAQARAELHGWEKNARLLLADIERNGDPGALRTLTERVQNTAAWGLVLMGTLQTGETLPAGLQQTALQRLRLAQSIEEEIVVALAYAVEDLLQYSVGDPCARPGPL